jgi:hypothetical protein
MSEGLIDKKVRSTASLGCRRVPAVAETLERLDLVTAGVGS